MWNNWGDGEKSEDFKTDKWRLKLEKVKEEPENR